MKIPQPNIDRLLATFLDLVQIDSHSREEAGVADYLEKILTGLNVKTWQDNAGEKIGGNCGNLHVRMPARHSDASAVLFSAHMDTVMPGHDVKPVVKDGIVYSDGTTVLGADDKAGVAAIVEMLRCLHESDIPHGPVEVIFDVAEEIGLMGAYEVDMDSVKAEFAIVLDGEEMDCIVNKSPSANRMVYEIDGIAAHAGMAPEKGISAIEVFAHAVSQMTLGRIDSETTANIGKVEAGTATNIVTPKLVANAEARSHSEETLKRQTESMSKAFRGAVEKFTRTIDDEIKVPVFREQIKREFQAIDVSTESLPFRLTWESGKLLGLEMKPMAIGGGTNASVYNEKGLPSVIIGCGMRAEHTTGEHLSIADLGTSTKLCLGIIAKHQEYSKK